jgi:hypothetical protein
MKDEKVPGKSMAPREFYGQFPKPAILQFQPESFTIIEKEEHLPLWEELLKQKVGLKILPKDFAKNIFKEGGTCCESGGTNDCDQD